MCHIYCICIFILMHYSLVKANGEEGPKIEAFMLLKPTSDKGALREIRSICFSQEKQLMELKEDFRSEWVF